MTVAELIVELQKLPGHLEVRTWDEIQDEYRPIVQVLYEDGTSSVDLLTDMQEVI